MSKTIARIIAGLLAVLMIAGACVQLLSVTVLATEPEAGTIDNFAVYSYPGGREASYISRLSNYDLTMDFIVSSQPKGTAGQKQTITSGFSVSNASWSWNSGTSQFSYTYSTSGSNWLVSARIENIQYRSTSSANRLSLEIPGFFATASNDPLEIDFSIPSTYFTRGTDPDGDSGVNPYESNIVIENVLVRDADDKTLDRIDKDTPPFTIDIIYADFGLREVADDLIDDAEMDAYMLETGGFLPSQGTKGSIRSIIRGSNDVPRFRATFSGVTWDGTSSSISFRVQYLIDGWYVDGDSTARVFAARPEDEEDDDKTAPPTPYIIISRYSYGSEAIEAGASFTLDMAFSNTSNTIDLENIVMTVSPIATSATEGTVPLSIASASNTYYYTGLPAGGGISEAIGINVKPDSSVGSAGVQISFTYEYVVDKERKSNDTSVDIAIPITQIDRFAVDPITDFDTWLTTGEEGWVSVSFVNRGKSTTYNVSGTLFYDDGTQGATEHFGNLQAGESGNLEFSPVFYEPGEQSATIVIQYEDENAEQKELSQRFTCTVEEPWTGGWEPPEIPEDPDEPEGEGMPTWKIVLLSIGGLAIAVPLALYVTLRVRAKGSEDFDEDF